MKRRVDPTDLEAVRRMTGQTDPRYIPRYIERGRAYDPATRRKYKDGYSPWQLSARQQSEWDKAAEEAGE